MIARRQFGIPSLKKSSWLTLIALLAITLPASAVTRSPKMPVAARWDPYEITLKSPITYTNPIQEATLSASFVSPLGEIRRVCGFWDGKKNWRVRFAPDMPGRWTFTTTCSDTANAGLHGQAGEFVCSAANTKTRFGLHGPIQVARDGRHLEHADHTPFFWVGDAAWEAIRRADPAQAQFYAKVRSSQKFNATQWTLAPGQDNKGQSAYTGKDCIAINLDFFKRLDAQVDALNRAGLLNAIAPLWEIGTAPDDALPDDQAILLLRYAVARWGANDVAWILAFEGENSGQKAGRWKKIGRAVFGEISHAPVILLPGETQWLLDEFRNENWVDVFGCQTARVLDEDSLQWLLTGPLTMERRKEPVRPLLTLMPPAENAPTQKEGKRLDADLTRRLLWWSALLNTPAGVSYSAQAVAAWDTTIGATHEGGRAELPAWQNELFLPGARDIEALGDFFSSIDYWRLQPFPRAIPNQPGVQSPRRFVAGEGTEDRDLLVVYVPEDRNVDVALGALPESPTMSWVSTRDGKRRSAIPDLGTETARFSTPDPGDWVLAIKERK